MARPKKPLDVVKRRWIQIKVSDSEHSMFNTTAEAAGDKTVAAMVMRLVTAERDRVSKPKPKRKPPRRPLTS